MSSHIDIKALRDRLNWSRAELADYLGLDRSSVSRLERGVQQPRGPTLRLLQQLSERQPAEVHSAAGS